MLQWRNQTGMGAGELVPPMQSEDRVQWRATKLKGLSPGQPPSERFESPPTAPNFGTYGYAPVV